MDDFLRIQDLHVQYNTDDATVYALNGIDLSLNRGEALGLVGETGAGKTTLALSIMRLLPARVGVITKGSIHLDDLNVLEASKKRLLQFRGSMASMILQDPMTSLNPTMKVGDQILEVLKLHHPEMSADARARRVGEVMEMVGIPAQRKGEYAHQFSGGMRQRIVIAIALVCEPELLLADEPTTALDVTIQAQILNLMRELKERLNTAVIMITHDLGIVAEFCQRVAIMYGGQIIETGTIVDVFSRDSIHPYTEGLFKCIPDLTTDTPRLFSIKGQIADPTVLDKGCRFASRCIYSTERCFESMPPLYTHRTHSVRCYRYEAWEEGV